MLTACRAVDDTDIPQQAPEFRKYYDQLREKAPVARADPAPGSNMSISVDGMPLTTFLRNVSDKTGVSVIAEDRLDEKLVTLDMKDQDVGLVLSVVARRLGVQVTRSGTLYYIGKLRSEDRGVLVRKVRRLEAEELQSAIGVLLSDNGRAVTYDDGLVVIGDRVEVLERITELLDGVESAPSNSWIVQLHLVGISDTFFRDVGIDVQPSGEMVAAFAADSISSGGSSFAAEASLRAVLSADAQRDHVKVVIQPAFILLDGGTATFRDATQTPIRIRNVSPEGTVTDVGIQTIQTGTEVDVTIREIGRDRARLTVNLITSTVAGTVEDVPVVDEQAFTTAASVEAGGIYLLGSFSRAREASQVRSITSTARRSESNEGELYLWARTYRIAAPAENTVKQGPDIFTGSQTLAAARDLEELHQADLDDNLDEQISQENKAQTNTCRNPRNLSPYAGYIHGFSTNPRAEPTTATLGPMAPGAPGKAQERTVQPPPGAEDDRWGYLGNSPSLQPMTIPPSTRTEPQSDDQPASEPDLTKTVRGPYESHGEGSGIVQDTLPFPLMTWGDLKEFRAGPDFSPHVREPKNRISRDWTDTCVFYITYIIGL